MSPTPISLIAEGLLDEQVLRQLIAQCAPHLEAGACYGKRGRNWVRDNIIKFNHAANTRPYVSLADLEQDECPPALLRDWIPQGIHTNLRPRIAVRMVESWLLADREACADFLRIPVHRIPQFPDEEQNPKQVMVNLARRSRSRIILSDMTPPQDAVGVVGKNYRGQLERFVFQYWNAERAQEHSPSLYRAIRCLKQFHPISPGY